MLESRVCRPQCLIEHIKWLLSVFFFSFLYTRRRTTLNRTRKSRSRHVENARRPLYLVRAARRVRRKRPLTYEKQKNAKTCTRQITVVDEWKSTINIYIYIRRRNDGTCADEMRRTEKGTTLRADGRTAFTMVREEALPSERTLN